MSNKVKSLARMFAGFPSYRPSPGMLTETLGVYLDVLEIYSEETVQEACARLTREAREFPPTAGEVRAVCERIMVASIPPQKALTDESRPFANDLTPEQRAENVRRLRELVVELGRGGSAKFAPARCASDGRLAPAPAPAPEASAGPVNVGPALGAYFERMAGDKGAR